MKDLKNILRGACAEGRDLAGDRTLAQIWQECPRGDWMIWLLRKSEADVSHVQWVRIAIACAESVAHLNPDARVNAAIDAAKAWCGMPTEATRAADAATRAATRAAAYAAAYAAARAAAYAAEKQRQADMIRAIVPNPFG